MAGISLNAWFEHETESGCVGHEGDVRKLVHGVMALKPPLFAAVMRMLDIDKHKDEGGD